jgi:hypothetical protein
LLDVKTLALHWPAAPVLTWLRQGQAAIAVFSATLFLSALLLFSVQPLFTKLVLPKLGGSPSVWAVAMCFFQVVLLAGYSYAYLLTRWVSAERAVLIHLGLMTVTCLALPFGVPSGFDTPPQDGAYFWLLGLLTVGVGLPFFAVSANAPLLQQLFSRLDTPHASDPYFLYGASNLGSLIALLAYPIAIEPLLGLKAQGALWYGGFVALAASIAACGGILHGQQPARSQAQAAPRPAAAKVADNVDNITWHDRLGWVALAFLPSGLVIAVTTYITTDIASAPFLWVIPLALFLMTFVLTFRERLPFNYRLVCEGLTVAALVTILTQTKLISSIAAIVAFFLAAIVCHRELYNRRPSARRLTEFYFWMSLGGVLGGVFAALIAPQIFTSVFEFPLLILLALLCRPGVLLGRDTPLDWRRLLLITGSVVVLLGSYKAAAAFGMISANQLYLAGLIALVLCGLVLIRKWPEHRPALVMTMIACAALGPADVNSLHVERGFFGTHRIMLDEPREVRLLLNGTTIHGAQRIKASDGRPVTAAIPATYYHPQGPMARGLEAARTSLEASGKPLAVGVVGLGSGSLAYYARGGETWRYFEIDPAVVRIASDPRYFDFLQRAEVKPDVVLGDARLTLAREPGGKFGYLLIDAFSSDSIPVHLLTGEALRQFLDKLDADGLLAIHISNRHLDLAPALAATIGQIPGVSSILVDDQRPSTGIDVMTSQVVFVTRKQTVIGAIASWPTARELSPAGASPWTDDYADVLGTLLRRIGKD